MGSRNSKSTRPGKRRASKTTEHARRKALDQDYLDACASLAFGNAFNAMLRGTVERGSNVAIDVFTVAYLDTMDRHLKTLRAQWVRR